ncbi:hypothetical protein C5F59_007650 [Streptomyces sp. QL37]|nr:hypothetical protein [Streptomyces sp. QL37]
MPTRSPWSPRKPGFLGDRDRIALSVNDAGLLHEDEDGAPDSRLG